MFPKILLRFLREAWGSRKAPAANASKPVYSPDLFDVDDLEAAKAVILNPMRDITTASVGR